MNYNISTEEFLEIVKQVWLESDLGDITAQGHPTDIYYTVEGIVNGVGRGLGHYIEVLRENERESRA